MRLTLQDKLAVMMTSAGSQRQLAALIGVSHQRVGRWLTIGQTTPMGEPSRVREPRDPDIRSAIDQAFAIHTEMARDQARLDHIPFNAALPVFAARLQHADGRPGMRVVIDHTHRMRDELRDAAIRQAQRSGRYHNVSVRSTVNVRKYFSRGERELANRRGIKPQRGKKVTAQTDPRWLYREEFKLDIAEGVQTRPIYTPYTPMQLGLPIDLINSEVHRKLRSRHEPATGDPGTALSDQILLQLQLDKDPIAAKSAMKGKHGANKRPAKSGKARKDKG